MPLCPVCKEVMVEVEEADVVAHSCPGCHGTWISGAALQRRMRMEGTEGMPHMAVAPLAEAAEEVSRSNSTGVLTCPTCLREMIKERFNEKIPVTIDRCGGCGYIWLDAGEQGMLVQLYRELAAEVTPGQEQRLAQLEALRRQRAEAAGAGGATGGMTTGYTTSYSSGVSGAEVATQVGMIVLSVLVDLMVPGYGHRYRW